uniref:hypothetical protein n=1 Tax=Succinivibrio sp. TaxID=2053619 RepID=UPI00402A9E83
MAPASNAVHTEQIVKDITSTTLCSYLIAHKYSLTKMTVDRIARTHLGDEIYQKKELLALEHLKGDFLKLKSQGGGAITTLIKKHCHFNHTGFH